MLTLTAKPRKKINRDKLVPGILYGHKIKNHAIEVKYNDFEKAYQKAGESALIDLKFDDKDRIVLIRDVQIDPVTDKYLHVDLYQIKMDEKLKTEVPIEFIGKSKAIEEKGGIFARNIDTVEIQALPKQLPHELKIDISILKDFGDIICIKDLEVPKGVEILADKDQVIATVVEPKVEEEPEKPEDSESETEEKQKDEEAKSNQDEEETKHKEQSEQN